MVNLRKILIIDYEATFRETISAALTRCGYNCTVAADPSDGIRFLKTKLYDLVLLDVMMEPFDGWNTLDALQNLSQGKDTPVIMISGKQLSIDELIRYGGRVHGYLKKPIFDEEICETVTDYFAWHDKLIQDTDALRAAFGSEEDCTKWKNLSRQIRVINLLKEMVSPFCLPHENLTEEECMNRKFSEIDRLISVKQLEIEEILKRCPNFYH